MFYNYTNIFHVKNSPHSKQSPLYSSHSLSRKNPSSPPLFPNYKKSTMVGTMSE